jgi:hypothetical protein
MKRILAALTVVVLAAGSAMAIGPMGGGMGAGGCCGMGKGATAADTAAHKKFINETMPLRQEMMNKHFEMQKEYIKETPDQVVMTKLKGEIMELRTKLMDARTKAGLPMGRGGKGMRGGMKHGMGGGMMDCPMMTAPPAQPAAK